MAKHGVLKLDETTNAWTFEDKTGLETLTTGVTTIFKPSEAVVGNPKLVSHVVAAVAGNAIAVHSFGRGFGVSALGKTLAMG